MLKRLTVLVVGWSFIVLGIIGLFLPILQGILFLCVGLIILSSEYAWARRWLEKARKRFPAVARQSDKAAELARSLKERLWGQSSARRRT
jgi:uncharacterized membrane protein YbaN (DUF454 family)